MNWIYYRSVFVKIKAFEDIKLDIHKHIYVTRIPTLNSLFRM